VPHSLWSTLQPPLSTGHHQQKQPHLDRQSLHGLPSEVGLQEERRESEEVMVSTCQRSTGIETCKACSSCTALWEARQAGSETHAVASSDQAQCKCDDFSVACQLETNGSQSHGCEQQCLSGVLLRKRRRQPSSQPGLTSSRPKWPYAAVFW